MTQATATQPDYRVTADHARLVYSTHRTAGAALAAASVLARRWGWSHPGSEPIAERRTVAGWAPITVAR